MPDLLPAAATDDAPLPALRPVRDADGEAIAALIAACFAEHPGCHFIWEEFPELRAPASWAAARRTRMWVTDGAEGAISGCICATPAGEGVVELHKFYVAAHLRGSGLAQRLAAQVLALAQETGARQIMLWTDTRFARAHRFYEKMGFVRGPEERPLHDVSNSIEAFYSLALRDTP